MFLILVNIASGATSSGNNGISDEQLLYSSYTFSAERRFLGVRIAR